MEKKKESTIYVPANEVEDVKNQYLQKLDDDPQYSLQVDPLGVYGMNDEEKMFINLYLTFENVIMVCQMLDIPEEAGKKYYLRTDIQAEIERLKIARYHHQFSSKILDIDEMGSYLTSLIMDQYVSKNDRLNPKNKLKAVELLMHITKMKYDIFNNSSPRELIDMVEDKEQVKEMSPKKIKELITKSQESKLDIEKEVYIDKLKTYGELSKEDIEYLYSLSIDELKKLVKKGETE